MKLMDKLSGKAASGRSRTGEDIRDHGEKEAVRMLQAGLKELGLPGGDSALAKLPKSDERKVLLALILRKKTTVSNYWIASSLAMGHPGSVSRMISAGRSDRRISERFHALDKAINNLADPQ
jgi:hypothetical protein